MADHRRHHRSRAVARLTAAAAVSIAVALVGVVPPPAGATEGPALQVPVASLDAAVHCPDVFTHTGEHEPVLLVHGTYTNDAENWSWNYLGALPSQGYNVCSVTLPGRALGDIQISSEYVVHAVRVMAAKSSGRRIDILGHSQGGLEPRWAVKYWPDVRAAVDDIVTLSGPHHGTQVANAAVAQGRCPAACWQMRVGANLLDALNGGDGTPGTVSVTSLYTHTDELVIPSVGPDPSPVLDGAANIAVQDLCPGRPVEHLGMAGDAAVFAMVIDAFTHDGPADPARFDVLTCARATFDGVDPAAFATLVRNARPPGFPSSSDYLTAEPPLQPYAQ